MCHSDGFILRLLTHFFPVMINERGGFSAGHSRLAMHSSKEVGQMIDDWLVDALIMSLVRFGL